MGMIIFVGVNKRCSFFTHTGIQAVLQDCGIRYTMADKEAVSVPFIHISQATFLKRYFEYNSDVGAVVARLEHDSIAKMLTTCVKSKGLTLLEHSMEVMRSALTEYFFYGKYTFEERRNIFKTIYHKYNMHRVKEFDAFMPTWFDLYDRYWDRA